MRLDPRHKEYWQQELASLPPSPEFERDFARVVLKKLEGYRLKYGSPLSIDLDFLAAALEAWDALDVDAAA